MKITQDKIQHFLYWFVGTLFLSWLFGIISGVVLAVLAGFAKEAYDIYKKYQDNEQVYLIESVYDLIADFLGIIVGISVVKLI